MGQGTDRGHLPVKDIDIVVGILTGVGVDTGRGREAEIVVVFIHRELVVQGPRHFPFSDVGDPAVLYGDLVDNRAGLVGLLPADRVLFGSPETIEDRLPLGIGQGVEISRDDCRRDGDFYRVMQDDDTPISAAVATPADPLVPIPPLTAMGWGGIISLPPCIV